MKKQGFTLAEVLITLGIIGVVAALTLPTLINKSKNKQYLSALAKFYSTFNIALGQYTADNNCPNDLKCTGLFQGRTDADITRIGEGLRPYFKIVKNCDIDLNNDCFPTAAGLNDGSTQSIDKYGSRYRFITADGMILSIGSSGDINCGNYFGEGALSDSCGDVFVDVNGLKAPNTIGRDVFYFFITSSGSILPIGVSTGMSNTRWQEEAPSSPTYKCSTSITSMGFGCAGRIVEEGWEMNY